MAVPPLTHKLPLASNPSVARRRLPKCLALGSLVAAGCTAASPSTSLVKRDAQIVIDAAPELSDAMGATALAESAAEHEVATQAVDDATDDAPTDTPSDADVSIDVSRPSDALGVQVQDAVVDAAYACAPQSGTLGWSPWSGSLPAAALNAVWGRTAGDVWAVGDYGTAVHWDCVTWSGVSTPAPISDLRGVWGSSSADVWAVGHITSSSSGGSVFHWNGVSWSLSIDLTATLAVTGLLADLNAVWGASADDVWAVGGGGFADGVGLREHCDPLILHWNGTAWSRVAAPNSSSGWVLEAIAGTSSIDVWAVGYRCHAGHSTNDEVLHWDGQLWSEVLTGLPDSSRPTAVGATSGSSVWAGGDFQWDGGVAHLARWGGSTWTVDPNEPDINPAVSAPTISSLWAGGATVGWAVGAYGLVLGWDGNQWTRAASGTALDLRGVWGSGAKEAWAVGGTSSTSRGITTSSGIVLHYVGQ